MATQTITLPFPSPSQNKTEKMHHMKRHKYRREMRSVIWTIALQAGLKPTWPRTNRRRKEEGSLFGPDPVRKRVTITRHNSRTLDHGNFVGGMKEILDAVVQEGYLFDDSIKWCDDEYLQKKAPKGKGYTEIRIEDVGQ